MSSFFLDNVKKYYYNVYMIKEQFNIRIDANIKDKLQEIADKETKKAGFTVTRSDIVNKALKEFIDKYKG